jgi:hypothetical protein
MVRISRLQWSLVAVLFAVAMGSPARADLPSFMFQLTQPGLVSTLDVNHVSTPVHTYQITGLGAGDVQNAAGYDPTTNRFYGVNNRENVGTASLNYLQLNSQGAVVSQNVIGSLSPTVTLSFGADYYNGRIWINQNDTNKVYGFDPSNLGAAQVVLTLPPPHPTPAPTSTSATSPSTTPPRRCSSPATSTGATRRSSTSTTSATPPHRA